MSDKSRAPALARAVLIMDILQKNRSCTISQLIATTGLPRSSVYVLIEEMAKLGLVRINADNTVQLWMKLISLGNSAAEFLNLRDIVTPHLEALMDTVECLAVHYGIMDNERAFYMVKKTSPRAGMQILSREGMPVNLVHAGLGKCLLAYQPPELRERLLSTLDYTPVTPNSITSAEALRAELANIRLQGWALDNNEGEAEIRCVAVPVFDPDNHLLGAISIVGTLSRFTPEAIPEVVVRAKQCALNISSSLIS